MAPEDRVLAARGRLLLGPKTTAMSLIKHDEALPAIT